MIGILLINLGTPDAPTTSAVRHYLRQFLSDPKVIDIHPIARWLLVNLIIAPFRSPKSAALYQKIWTKEGSPLLIHTENLARAVGQKLGSSYAVEIGMRYGNPSIASAVRKLVEKKVEKIRVLPLFPQYAASSTGSAIEEVSRVAGKLGNIPPIETIPPFFDHPGFIRNFAGIGKPVLERIKPDQILFSFHGLPERHIQKGDPYQKQCFRTAELIAAELGLPSDIWKVSFQSRLGRTPWIKPYTDLLLLDLAKAGKKRIVVFCPAFVADCLETLEEIGIRNREAVIACGAETLELVPSLNSHPKWVETVCEMVR